MLKLLRVLSGDLRPLFLKIWNVERVHAGLLGGGAREAECQLLAVRRHPLSECRSSLLAGPVPGLRPRRLAGPGSGARPPQVPRPRGAFNRGAWRTAAGVWAGKSGPPERPPQPVTSQAGHPSPHPLTPAVRGRVEASTGLAAIAEPKSRL